MDGVLLVDKPLGPTSHAVVDRVRHATRQRSIGHTGTLDPRATGLLPLVLGRATRLATFLSSGDKTYDAIIELGVATDTDDAAGQPLGAASETVPGEEEVAAALDGFRGTFEQVPPAHSAKKIAGEKAYTLARQNRPVELKPVSVTVHVLDYLGRVDRHLTVRVRATAGFYVRALARDLGQRLGCGAHLAGLRRTAAGAFHVNSAIELEEVERLGLDVASRLISPANALAHFPAVEVTDLGRARVLHGNPLSPEQLAGGPVTAAVQPTRMRVLDREGVLLAVAEPRHGLLHPIVVLG